MKCVVVDCNSTNNSKACEMSFFLFPTDPKIQKQWSTFCGRGKELNPRTSYVCMLHFKPDDIANSLQYKMGFAEKRLLKRGTVPSITLVPLKNKILNQEPESNIKKRKNKNIVPSILQEYNSIKSKEQVNENEADNIEPGIFEEINTGKSQSNFNMEDGAKVKDQLRTLRKKKEVLKSDKKKLRCKRHSLCQEMLTLKNFQKNMS